MSFSDVKIQLLLHIIVFFIITFFYIQYKLAIKILLFIFYLLFFWFVLLNLTDVYIDISGCFCDVWREWAGHQLCRVTRHMSVAAKVRTTESLCHTNDIAPSSRPCCIESCHTLGLLDTINVNISYLSAFYQHQ